MLQEFNRRMMSSSMHEFQVVNLNPTKNNDERIFSAETSVQDETYYLNITEWKAYSIKLSRTLCSFLLAPEDINFHHGQASVGQSSLPIWLAYWELSIRWVVKVLLAVFPCIKACANESQLPNHIR